jgi:aspartate aminotransferase
MRIASRAAGIKPSVTLEVSRKMKEIPGAISFGAGEPDFPTPKHIAEAGKAAIDEGFTKYVPASGTVALREAICEQMAAETGLTYSPSEVIVSDGAKATLFVACQAIVEPGDEVLIIAPYWLSYPEMVALAGGKSVFVPTTDADGFVPDPAAVEERVTDRTVALIVNSPSNPTGAVYPRQTMLALAEIADRHDLYLISDEIYNKLIYEGEAVCPATFGEAIRARTLVVNGVAKTYSMTGWRIGWGLGPRALIAAMDAVQSHATSGPCSISDRAATEAIRGPQDEVARMREAFRERRDTIVRRLSEIEGVSIQPPKGAFYVFPNVSALYGTQPDGTVAEGSVAFSSWLVGAAGVGVVPGLDFGADECVRLSYATSMDDINEGLDRIQAALKR